MSNSWMGALELVLVFGLVIGLAVRELVHLRRDNEAARRRSSAPPSAGSTPESASSD